MKRVLPIMFLITTLKIYLIVVIGIWLFSPRYVNISDVKIIKENVSTDPHQHYVHFISNDKEYTSIMSVDNYNFFYKKNRQLRYIYADTYVFLGIIYILFCIFYGIWLIIQIIDFFVIYEPYRDKGDRFDSYDSITPNYYAEFYNFIDAYDLTPMKVKFLNFFGY